MRELRRRQRVPALSLRRAESLAVTHKDSGVVKDVSPNTRLITHLVITVSSGQGTINDRHSGAGIPLLPDRSVLLRCL